MTFFDQNDDMTPGERQRLLEEVVRDPVTMRQLAVWESVETALRTELNQVLGDTESLVQYALARTGDFDLVAKEESPVSSAHRQALDEGVRRRASASDIVARIEEDAKQFDAEWRREFAVPVRTDRVAVPHRSRTGPVRIGWRLAAAIAVTVFVSALLFVSTRENARVTLDVTADSIRELSLSDGSHVRLIGQATLSYVPSAAPLRPTRVSLSGNAYFDIVSGDTPFVVETPTAIVSVLGTNFGIRSQSDETEVVLASGTVSVTGLDGSSGVVLQSGQSSTIRRGSSPSKPVDVDLTESLSWSGLFVFRGVEMSEVGRILSDHYQADVTMDPELGDQRVSGTFDRHAELSDILNILATSLGASVTREGPQTRLTVPR